MEYKPRIFIGSSTTAKPLAKALAALLKKDAVCRPWCEETFRPARTTIEDLERTARSEADFAVLILTPDDLRNRGAGYKNAPRDNVLFELGLFMGALGRERAFGLQCRKCQLDLPTDLWGINWLKFKHLSHGKKLLEVDRKIVHDRLRPAAQELIKQFEHSGPSR